MRSNANLPARCRQIALLILVGYALLNGAPADASTNRTTVTSSPAATPRLQPSEISARASSSLSRQVDRRLQQAFDLALVHLEAHPACDRLFEHLENLALDSMSLTLYAPASARLEDRLCRRGVSAFTTVGSRVTYLCRGFGGLAAPRAAAILIHEALHLAGLPESPVHPGALASAEINEMVASSCRL